MPARPITYPAVLPTRQNQEANPSAERWDEMRRGRLHQFREDGVDWDFQTGSTVCSGSGCLRRRLQLRSNLSVCSKPSPQPVQQRDPGAALASCSNKGPQQGISPLSAPLSGLWSDRVVLVAIYGPCWSPDGQFQGSGRVVSLQH